MKTWSKILVATSALFLLSTGLRAQSTDRGAPGRHRDRGGERDGRALAGHPGDKLSTFVPP